MRRPSLLASILNPEDFQDFGNKLAERLYNKESILGTAEGRDRGIDGYDSLSAPSIIIQSKRVKDFSERALRDEVAKIEAAKEYFGWSADFDYALIVSFNLSIDRRKRLIDASSGLISGDEFLVDSKRIDELSDNPDFEDIFRHYKLIESSLADLLRDDRLQAIEVESEHFLAAFDPEFFVETDPFYHSLEVLLRDRILLIQGDPGVGKSTMTTALAHSFANGNPEKRTVVYRSFDKVGEVINTYNQTYRGSENALLVVFDDFLGKNYLSAAESNINQFVLLCNLVDLNDNIFVVLNSRTQILNEAKRADTSFKLKLDDSLKSKITVIDLSRYSENDKAKILRANYLKSLSGKSRNEQQQLADNYEQLRMKKTYWNIIKHQNFSPRLIELITSQLFDTKEYPAVVIAKLNNPEDIYNGLFDKLSHAERMYLFSLLQFRKYWLKLELLRVSLVPHSEKYEFDFDAIESKLTESWIRIVRVDLLQEAKIGFLNPSIVDFLDNKSSSLKAEILEKSCLISQLEDSVSEDELLPRLFEKYSTFADRLEFSDEYLIARIKFRDNLSNLAKNLSEKILAFNGQYSFTSNFGLFRHSASGWRKLATVIEESNSTALQEVFCNLVFYASESEDIQRRMMDSVMGYGMREFDLLIEALGTLLLKTSGTNLFEDLSEAEEEILLFKDRVIEVKAELIQSEIDHFTYDLDSAQAEIFDARISGLGVAHSGAIELMLSDALDVSWGRNFAIYEELESHDWDISEIERIIEEEIERIEDEEREENYIDAYDIWKDKQHEVESPRETVDDILDKPLF